MRWLALFKRRLNFTLTRSTTLERRGLNTNYAFSNKVPAFRFARSRIAELFSNAATASTPHWPLSETLVKQELRMKAFES